jgi:hypothetical protein
LALQHSFVQVRGEGVTLVLGAPLPEVIGGEGCGLQGGLSMGQIGEGVLVVHPEQQLAGLDLVPDVDVDILHLAGGLGVNLKVVDGFNLSGGGKLLGQIGVGDLG